MKSILVGMALLMGVAAASAQDISDEQQFQEMAAYLKANDAERQAAVSTCLENGIGDDPQGVAELMGVPVEEATAAWCKRMTNGIADGLLTLPDVNALSSGTVTPRALQVLKAE